MHSPGEAQTLRDNCPEEVPEFSEHCASHRSDIVAFPGIVAQGDSIRLMPDPSAVAVRQGKVQIVASAALQAIPGAPGPLIDSASQGIVHCFFY